MNSKLVLLPSVSEFRSGAPVGFRIQTPDSRPLIPAELQLRVILETIFYHEVFIFLRKIVIT
jgi:hypothetical protein